MDCDQLQGKQGGHPPDPDDPCMGRKGYLSCGNKFSQKLGRSMQHEYGMEPPVASKQGQGVDRSRSRKREAVGGADGADDSSNHSVAPHDANPGSSSSGSCSDGSSGGEESDCSKSMSSMRSNESGMSSSSSAPSCAASYAEKRRRLGKTPSRMTNEHGHSSASSSGEGLHGVRRDCLENPSRRMQPDHARPGKQGTKRAGSFALTRPRGDDNGTRCGGRRGSRQSPPSSPPSSSSSSSS